MSITAGPPHFQGFDDLLIKQQYYLQAALKQRAPLTTNGGREILHWCQVCQSPWYKGGHREIQTHLSPAQFKRLALDLCATVSLPSQLPQAFCPCCMTRFFGGIAHLEEYPHDLGYRLFWERAKAPALFLCCLYKCHAVLQTDHLWEALTSSTDVPLPLARVRGVLQWLSTLADPEWYQMKPFSADQRGLLTKRYPPAGNLTWCGYAWKGICPALEGPVVVSLGMTFDASASCSAAFLLECWRQIAIVMKASYD